jgi:uncharacterized protein involved in exopolysaccharide biosynthesis
MIGESAIVTRVSPAPPAPTPRDLATILFRRPRLVAAVFFLTLAGVLICVVLSSRYESHFKVLLRRGRVDPAVSAQTDRTMSFAHSDITEEELNSEVELLRDQDLLKQVVIMAALIPSDTPGPERPAAVEHAVRRLVRRLNVEGIKKSNLIQVSYQDPNPERAARILAALSTLYVQRHAALQRPAGELRFFDEQTADYEQKLQQSEAELVRFTRDRGVASAALERDITLQKLGEADAAYRMIDQDRVETERRIGSLSEQLKLFPSRSVTVKRWADNPEILEKMKTHLLELQLKRSDLLARFQPSYRLVQEVEREIEETKGAIAGESLTPVRDETTDKDPNYEWARLEMERAQVQRDGLRARQVDALAQVASLRMLAQQRQSESVDQQDLLRSAKADEDNYLLYLRKREEARIGDALDERRILNVAIVESPQAAALPRHSTLFYTLCAFGMAVISGVSAAFVAEYFDPTLRTPSEVHRLLDLPVLAWLPAPERSVLQLISGLSPAKETIP